MVVKFDFFRHMFYIWSIKCTGDATMTSGSDGKYLFEAYSASNKSMCIVDFTTQVGAYAGKLTVNLNNFDDAENHYGLSLYVRPQGQCDMRSQTFSKSEHNHVYAMLKYKD